MLVPDNGCGGFRRLIHFSLWVRVRGPAGLGWYASPAQASAVCRRVAGAKRSVPQCCEAVVSKTQGSGVWTQIG